MFNLQSLIYNKKNFIALLHININSLKLHFGKLKTVLTNCLFDSQILGITESRLKEATPATWHVILPSFNLEHMPTKSANEAALLYIKYDIN